jgi:hypothetical protein
MASYSLIIQNIIKPEVNMENTDELNYFLNLYFKNLLNQTINVKNKFLFFTEAINNFFIKKKYKNEFINYFCKIQKTYNNLNKFALFYKYKKAKIVVNTDMCLNNLTNGESDVICIMQNNSKYLFHIKDLIKIINVSLMNADTFFLDPTAIKNPYNNIPFNKSILYNIYFFIKYNTHHSCELLNKFFNVDFNLTIFRSENEYLLNDYIINNYVKNSTKKILVKEIRLMISEFNKKGDFFISGSLDGCVLIWKVKEEVIT